MLPLNLRIVNRLRTELTVRRWVLTAVGVFIASICATAWGFGSFATIGSSAIALLWWSGNAIYVALHADRAGRFGMTMLLTALLAWSTVRPGARVSAFDVSLGCALLFIWTVIALDRDWSRRFPKSRYVAQA